MVERMQVTLKLLRRWFRPYKNASHATNTLNEDKPPPSRSIAVVFGAIDTVRHKGGEPAGSELAPEAVRSVERRVIQSQYCLP